MKKISLFMLGLIASLFFVSCGDNDSNNPYDPDAPGTSTSQKRLKGVTFSCELDVDYEGKVRYSFDFNNIRYDSEGRIGSVHLKSKDYPNTILKSKKTHKSGFLTLVKQYP